MSSFIEHVVGWAAKSSHTAAQGHLSSMMSSDDIPMSIQTEMPHQDLYYSGIVENRENQIDEKHLEVKPAQKIDEPKIQTPDEKNFHGKKNSKSIGLESHSEPKIVSSADSEQENNADDPKEKKQKFFFLTKDQNIYSDQKNTDVVYDDKVDQNQNVEILKSKIPREKKSDYLSILPGESSNKGKFKDEKNVQNIIATKIEHDDKSIASMSSLQPKLFPENIDDKSVSLAPSLSQKLFPQHIDGVKQQENVVTINIGRIEVKAEIPEKKQLSNFSYPTPELSLNDYLKRRQR